MSQPNRFTGKKEPEPKTFAPSAPPTLAEVESVLVILLLVEPPPDPAPLVVKLRITPLLFP